MSELSDLGKWISNSITVKLVIIGFIFLVLLIPSSMIQSLVNEREQLSNEVTTEIGSKWGGNQVISGPVLSVPMERIIPGKEQDQVIEETAHFLPENLQIHAEVVPEIRKRGMYRVVVYRSVMTLTGTFKNPDYSQLGMDPASARPAKAFLSIGIPDMRGIRESVNIQFGSTNTEANPGLKSKDIIATGVTAPVNLDELKEKGEIPFSVKLQLNGSGMAGFIPLGRNTEVTLHSTWAHPSFEGAYLPDQRQLSDTGFNASWKVLHLNRDYPQQWTGNAFNVEPSSFGVRFLIPVDHYQKVLRSVKYAVMFISLTFLVFFFIEILYHQKVHPLQYLLVGTALLIFFTLLLSITEQINFNLAYLLSASAVVTLISLYAGSIFRRKNMGWITAGFLVVLYGFLFILLQLQDYALLMGSIGLFAIIATVMYLSRKVKWYNDQA